VDAVEAIGIARTWKAIGPADALLLIVDDVRRYRSRSVLVDRPAGETEAGYVFNKIDLFGDAPRAEEDEQGCAFTSRPRPATASRAYASVGSIGWLAVGEGGRVHGA